MELGYIAKRLLYIFLYFRFVFNLYNSKYLKPDKIKLCQQYFKREIFSLYVKKHRERYFYKDTFFAGTAKLELLKR